MPRIAGVNIPENKRIEISLTYIYGIGRSLSNKILEAVNIDKELRASKLTADQINELKREIEARHRIEGELRHDVMTNIKRLKDVGSYHGIRHIKGLPVRGQQTKTNSRTVRGNVRKTMRSGKRAIEKT